MEYHFRFSLSEDEFAEFNAYTGWLAPWQKKTRKNFAIRTFLYSAFSFTATLILLQKIAPLRQNNDSFLVVSAIVILILVVWISYYQAPYQIRNKARKLVNKDENKHMLNQTEMEISDNNLVIDDNGSKTIQAWSSITRLAVTKDFFYLYINTIQAHIIPKRLFSSQKEVDEFDNFLTHKIPLSSSFRSLGI